MINDVSTKGFVFAVSVRGCYHPSSFAARRASVSIATTLAIARADTAFVGAVRWVFGA